MPKLTPLDQPQLAPLTISSRLRGQLVYFAAVAGGPGVPALGDDEYYFRPEEVETFLEEGVLQLVSPLDTANMTEVELSEEQEAMLEWLRRHGVRHVRAEDSA